MLKIWAKRIKERTRIFTITRIDDEIRVVYKISPSPIFIQNPFNHENPGSLS